MNEQPRLEDRRISGETLTWGHTQLVTFIARSHLAGCDITITCPSSGIIITDCSFTECSIRVTRPLRSHQFFSAVFERCRFQGRFPGCEFGFRPVNPDESVRGYVKDCDLTGCELDLVTINNSDPSSLRFPFWPHVVITQPGSTVPSLAASLADPAIQVLAAAGPWEPATTAIILTYKPHTNRRGFSTSPEALKQVLRQFPTVWFTDP